MSREPAGTLAATFAEAIRLRDAMRADGATRAELERAMEITIRAAWPFKREWHYLCSRCDDLGWDVRVCETAGQCGRPFTLPGQGGNDATGRGQCSPGHSYAVPCVCAKGQSIRDGLLKRSRATDDDFAQAGKSKPAKNTMTRFGR